MSHKVQLDLFIEENEVSLLRKELKALTQQHERLKRSMYARHNDLSRFYLKLEEENEELKRRLDALERSQRLPEDASNDDLLEKLFKEAYFASS